MKALQTVVGLHRGTMFVCLFIYYFIKFSGMNQQESVVCEEEKKGYHSALGSRELTPSSVPLTSTAYETKLVLR